MNQRLRDGQPQIKIGPHDAPPTFMTPKMQLLVMGSTDTQQQTRGAYIIPASHLKPPREITKIVERYEEQRSMPLITPSRFEPLKIEERLEPPMLKYKWDQQEVPKTDLSLETSWRQPAYEDPPYRPPRVPPRTPELRFPLLPPFKWGAGGGPSSKKGRRSSYGRKQIHRPIGDIQIFGKKENLYGTKFLNNKTVSSILELGK